MASHAYFPRSPSASASSKVIDIRTLLLFAARNSEPFSYPPASYEHYDLDALAVSVGVQPKYVKSHASDKLAQECVEAIFPGLRVCKEEEVVSPTGVKISALPAIVSSTHERAGVLLYSKDGKKLLTFIEVQSSPMLYTERKTILGAANVIRFLRSTDLDFTEFTAFAFPNKSQKQCVIKITVVWEQLKFWYTMERIPNLKDVKKQLLDVVKEQINRVPELPDQVNTQYLIHLSTADLRVLSKSDAIKQIPSRHHIIAMDDSSVYKIFIDGESIFSAHSLYCDHNLFILFCQNQHE